TAALIAFGDAPASFSDSGAYNLFQNWKSWMQKGYLDAGCPMNYKREHYTDQAQWYRNWVDAAVGWRYDRHMFCGQANYLNSMPNSITQLQYVYSHDADGSVNYCYFYTADHGMDGSPWDNDWNWYPYVASNLFTSPAALPTMSWRNPATATEGTLWGRVFDGMTGEPIDDATVEVNGLPAVKTDGNGYYVVTMIPASLPGTLYDVTANTSDYSPAIAEDVLVVPGEVRRKNFALSYSVVIADFEDYPEGSQVVFRQPSYSGSTNAHLDLTTYNVSEVTRAITPFAGLQCYLIEWEFVDSSPIRWLRATSHTCPNMPNPTIELDKPIRVRMQALNGPVRVTLGIRETGTTAPVGEDGGTAGTIEWVGARSKADAAPQGKLLAHNPGVWQTLVFNPARDPIMGFTGDGVLSAPNNKGTIESFAFACVDWAGPIPVYIDDIEQFSILPLYVDAAATGGANDGTSWADAFTELQSALAAAGADNEIRVAGGTYKPDYDVGTGLHTGDRSVSFQLVNGLGIYGGYAGSANPGDPDQCDPRLYETILDGDLNGLGTASSYNVVTANGVDPTAVLDGVTITGGRANGSGDQNHGGGMYTIGDPTIRNCTFRENHANGYGGGMYVAYIEGIEPILTNCAFIDNVAVCEGGGLYNPPDGRTVLVNCVFMGNHAQGNGGGMYNASQSNPTVVNCTFSRNVSDAGLGGGMYILGDAQITNSVFWGNSASGGSVQSQQIDDTGGWYVSVEYSCIQDDDPDDGSVPYGGSMADNIDDDPRFVDADAGPLSLLSGSPCMDAGANGVDTDPWLPGTQPLPATDISGNGRILDADGDLLAKVDMGAYESQQVAVDTDLDLGEEITLIPGGGSGNPMEDTKVTITNTGGPEDAWVSVIETIGDPHGEAGGFAAFGKTLTITTSLTGGQYRMTIQVPFDEADVPDGDDPLLATLGYYQEGSGMRKLAVEGNTAQSTRCGSDCPDATCPDDAPACPSPMGCRHVVEATEPDAEPFTPPSPVDVLGDYGLFWNSHVAVKKGFVWANVNHATDFGPVVAVSPVDFNRDGDVDTGDEEVFEACATGPDVPYLPADPPLGCPMAGGVAGGDLDQDGDVDQSDFAIFQRCLSGTDHLADPTCGY
ncbi:MAG: hypothetical protein JXO22_03795, partial [Phycisphaerae bacterium]|nr:hypothetical protein [Phycisphaerae bacterium]